MKEIRVRKPQSEDKKVVLHYTISGKCLENLIPRDTGLNENSSA